MRTQLYILQHKLSSHVCSSETLFFSCEDESICGRSGKFSIAGYNRPHQPKGTLCRHFLYFSELHWKFHNTHTHTHRCNNMTCSSPVKGRFTHFLFNFLILLFCGFSSFIAAYCAESYFTDFLLFTHFPESCLWIKLWSAQKHSTVLFHQGR